VFQFALYSKARPENVALRKGKISVPGGDTRGVSITITDTKTEKKSFAMYDTTTGEYALIANATNPSVISINKKGILLYFRTNHPQRYICRKASNY